MKKILFLVLLCMLFMSACDMFKEEEPLPKWTLSVQSSQNDYLWFVNGNKVTGDQKVLTQGNYQLIAFLEGYDVINQEGSLTGDQEITLDFTAMTTILQDDFTDSSNLSDQDMQYSILSEIGSSSVTDSILTCTPIDNITEQDHMWIISLVNQTALTDHKMAVHLEMNYDILNNGSFFMHMLDGFRISDDAHSFYHFDIRPGANNCGLATVVEATPSEGDLLLESDFVPSIFTDTLNTLDLIIDEEYFYFIANETLIIAEMLDASKMLSTADYNLSTFGFGVHGPSSNDAILLDSLNCYK